MSLVTQRPADISSLYVEKAGGYFTGARHDMLAKLNTSADSSILEIGCGDGATGVAALTMGKATVYVGIELMPTVAEQARAHLSEVIVGNVEHMDLAPLHARFDALILSEVLEHLTDPWATLSRLALCLKPGGMVIASSPNVAHWRLILNLILGRFEYQDAGVMDRTHLRWFTPTSYAELLRGAGFSNVTFVPLRTPGLLARTAHAFTLNRFAYLSNTQIMVHGHWQGR